MLEFIISKSGPKITVDEIKDIFNQTVRPFPIVKYAHTSQKSSQLIINIHILVQKDP